jgi:hypothetical protein
MVAKQLDKIADDDSEVDSMSEEEDEKENDQSWLPKTPRNKNKFITPMKRPRRDL